MKAKTKRGKSGRFEQDVTALEIEWNKRLKNCGLGMDRGLKVGSENIIYGQDIRVLDFFGSRTFEVIEQGERLES